MNFARIPHQQAAQTANVFLVARDLCSDNQSFQVYWKVSLDVSIQKLLQGEVCDVSNNKVKAQATNNYVFSADP